MPVQKTAVLTSSHDRLREAAKDLFADRGYESTPTAEICRLAGTSQSQLIKHFSSKLGLLEAVLNLRGSKSTRPSGWLPREYLPLPTS